MLQMQRLFERIFVDLSSITQVNTDEIDEWLNVFNAESIGVSDWRGTAGTEIPGGGGRGPIPNATLSH